MSLKEYDVDRMWIDGSIESWEDAYIHVLSHVVHYGTNVLEGMRCYDTVDGPAVFRNEAHFERFQHSAKIVDMDLEYSREELMTATKDLIRETGLESCYIRPIAFYGFHELGLDPGDCPLRTVIAVWPWGAYMGEAGLEEGVEVRTSSWRRFHSSQLPSTAKVGGPYVQGMVAHEDATRDGYDEALMLDAHGNVAEGTGENLFVVEGDRLSTPPVSSSILNGITRRSVMTIARDLGYEVVEREVGRGEVYTADELFFTGSAAEVTPIRSVDGRQIGDGTVGPVAEEIQTTFFEVVRGEREEYHDWLDFV